MHALFAAVAATVLMLVKVPHEETLTHVNVTHFDVHSSTILDKFLMVQQARTAAVLDSRYRAQWDKIPQLSARETNVRK